MKLKRLYHRILNDAGQPMQELARVDGQPVIDPVTHKAKTRIKIMRDNTDTPIVRGVVIQRLPASGEQKFSPRLVKGGIAEGWLVQHADRLEINCAERGVVIFTIGTTPGRFCLHCNEQLPGIDEDPTGILARRHIDEQHAGAKHPDNPRWPHGYEVRNYYHTRVEG